jgi:hypothetical protein
MRQHLASRLGWAFSISLSLHRSCSLLFQLVSDQPFFFSSILFCFRPLFFSLSLYFSLLHDPFFDHYLSLSTCIFFISFLFFCLVEEKEERKFSPVLHSFHPIAASVFLALVQVNDESTLMGVRVTIPCVKEEDHDDIPPLPPHPLLLL